MGKRKKQYSIEEQIFSIYPDFPVLINDSVIWNEEVKPLHFHYYLEIGYCFEGKGYFSSNRQTVEIGAYDITVTAPNILHTTRSNADIYTRFCNIYVDLSDLVKLFPEGESKTKLKRAQESLQDFFCLDGRSHQDILWLIQEIIRLGREEKQRYRMQILSLLYAMLLKIYDVISDGKRENIPGGSINLPIMPAIQYIFDHYMEPIKIRQLAELCHFSESYFRKVFLEMKGVGPMTYLNWIRVRAACQLLTDSEDSVRMIGEKCGFPSITTFERNFKQRTGMLPSQWRENQQSIQKRHRKSYEIKKVFNQKE
ncbi:MAG: AraC family transcriptional regulator [Dorea sp.]|jgi:AraC-like DNA-binding protein/quercetin dioxygenase-like cupin family protein|nr:AraC family transcriptional regulator [Dorea sp.]MCI9616011.1 AraC family transcriptional regulator [Dorea sp.]MDE6937570.1 AraC family transcriptional regulator [Lachnospiraceae bacterium]MDE7037962.1 AraC family transcriptional regulator [Lachnospiraceae bacterium]